MNLSFSTLQSPINQLELLEWLLASIALVVVVTMIYVFVLNKSPPPEGRTIAKAEQSALITQAALDPTASLLNASSALRENNHNGAIENSAEAVRLCLSGIMEKLIGQKSEGMGISELAFLVQSKEKSGPSIAEPVYQLSNLRLRVAQNIVVSSEEATWAVSFANWLVQSFQSEQIKF